MFSFPLTIFSAVESIPTLAKYHYKDFQILPILPNHGFGGSIGNLDLTPGTPPTSGLLNGYTTIILTNPNAYYANTSSIIGVAGTYNYSFFMVAKFPTGGQIGNTYPYDMDEGFRPYLNSTTNGWTTGLFGDPLTNNECIVYDSLWHVYEQRCHNGEKALLLRDDIQTAISPSNVSISSSLKWFSIGGKGTGISNATTITGEIAEIIVFEQLLTPTESTEIHDYLQTKFAI